MTSGTNIRVLYVTHYRQLYGANNSLLQLILELRDKGIRPTVLLPKGNRLPGNDLAEELDRQGIPHIESDIRIDKHKDWIKVIPNYFLACLGRKKTYKIVKDLQFDMIHSNSSVTSIGAYLAAKLKIPHIWHLREFGRYDYDVRSPFGKQFQKILYGGHNTFIAISKEIRRHYIPFIGKQQIRLIYNGIKPSFLTRNEAVRNRVEICIVGLLRKEKGQMELIKAAQELVERHRLMNFHVTIIGNGDPEYEAQISEYIGRHGLQEYITMTGHRSDVAELLTNMDIGVMASSHEAFGRVTVEYMMAGLAVVASDGGANLEIIDDKTTGLIYPGRNASALSECLAILIRDQERRKQLAIAGREKALKKYISTVNSDAVYSLYNEIIGNENIHSHNLL